EGLVRKETADGFESQFGVNYLGPFALTALLWPLLLRASHPRVVAITSISHYFGRINFDDLNARKHYSPFGSYTQSKLALILFTAELQRRSREAGAPVAAVAVHPGLVRTKLYDRGEEPGRGGGVEHTLRSRLARRM